MRAVTSPRLQARIAGFLYMIVVIASVYALYTGPGLNAENASVSELQFRLSFTAFLIANAGYIGVVAILYELFKPVSRTLSVVAAFFGLAGCAASGINMVNHLAPLYFLGEGGAAAAFSTEQLQALARVSFKFYVLGMDIGFMYFGFYCCVIAVLIFGSTFLPRILGLTMLIAGIGWLTYSFASFIAPPLGNSLSAYVNVSAAGEILFTLWLLVFGVNAEKWREQAGWGT